MASNGKHYTALDQNLIFCFNALSIVWILPIWNTAPRPEFIASRELIRGIFKAINA